MSHPFTVSIAESHRIPVSFVLRAGAQPAALARPLEVRLVRAVRSRRSLLTEEWGRESMALVF